MREVAERPERDPAGAPPAVAVLDTSALLYYAFDRAQLTGPATRAIAEAERRLVLSVSLWEIALKHARGNLEMPVHPRVFAERLERASDVSVVPLDSTLAVAGALLDWDHRDPADRWIVALAVRHRARLVTSDRAVRDFYPEAVW